jgi:Beta propeller domain
MYRTVAAATTVAAIAAGAAFGIGIGSEPSGPATPDPETPRSAERGLVAYSSCDALLSTTRARAASMVHSWGFGGAERTLQFSPTSTVALAEDSTAAPAGEAKTAPGFSGTNVQEAGVDEPDLMKTDGTTMYVAGGGVIRALNVTGGSARQAGTLSVAGAGNLLLSGDRLLVIGTGDGPGTATERYQGDAATSQPVWGTQGVVLTLVDVSDPAAMRVIETLRLEGWFVSGRLTDSSVRVVITTPPELPAITGPQGQGPMNEVLATLRNRVAIAGTGADAWLPSYAVDRAGQPGEERPLVDCTDVSRPAAFSGLGMVTVATLDLTKGVTPVDTDAIQTDGQTVYGSPQSLYVATTRWSGAQLTPADASPQMGTEIHRFDTSAAGTTEYRGSGKVDGYLLSQWSMSEHEGVLRVASTEEGTWSGTEATESESYVTTLDVTDDGLTTRARVGGLGRGERIYAVRFMGDMGYVVTFRQTDPLYVIDLSDPGHPRTRGELEIPGYSAYLHPVGDGLLLGVGQDANDEGRVKGTQLSLFDVSDPAAPRRVSQRSFPGAWSEAESDHHAFLYWPSTGLTVIPMQGPNPDGTWSARARAVMVKPGEEIRDVGGIVHAPNGAEAPIQRSAVVGDALYTVSAAGVAADTLDNLARRAWVPFS